ncbi:AAA family ATPase [Streptodolium elevatio]
MTDNPGAELDQPADSQPSAAIGHGRSSAESDPSPTELIRARLASSTLSPTTKALLADVLAESVGECAGAAGNSPRVYVDSVAVTGFRGIGPTARLRLRPAPGVTLVVGRNGCGKSSFAEAVETAFTGTSSRWEDRSAVWRSNWRNLHHSGDPKVELKLSLVGDCRSSLITRTWDGDDVANSQAEFRRPGHGRRPLAEAGWDQALTDHRPFLSYSDLERVIGGKPSEMYDAVAVILGLGGLNAADGRLQAEEKALTNALKETEGEVPELVELMSTLNDHRAATAVTALTPAGRPDFATLEALVDGLPDADDDHLRELRATSALVGPDLDVVGSAAARLREAAAVMDDIRVSDAEEAHQRAELLALTLEHRRRHPEEVSCPACGSDRLLEETWAEWTVERIDTLRSEAAAAREARDELRAAIDTVRHLVAPRPEWVPTALAVPWRDWTACCELNDPRQLADRAEDAALVLAGACQALREKAAQELAELDESWRRAAGRLAGWLHRARTAHAGKPRLRDLKTARKWLREAAGELRGERLRPFAERSQRIWEELRQQSNVDLRSVRLAGSDKASVRKLVMDVAVDGQEASALSVMSQGELHSLALALFLPRATAVESPFGFVVIDDPVQSMDPAKVYGLAQVLHALGETRQVVVFTHDTRLQRAFTAQELPVTVLEVVRSEGSVVNVRKVGDPVAQAIADARAWASSQNPTATTRNVLPALCRVVLETAFAEAAWRRLHRSGTSEAGIAAAIERCSALMELAALGLFGNSTRTGDVYAELRRRCGADAIDDLKRCQEGAHGQVAAVLLPQQFVTAIARMAEIVRKPEEAQ